MNGHKPLKLKDHIGNDSELVSRKNLNVEEDSKKVNAWAWNVVWWSRKEIVKVRINILDLTGNKNVR
jgi:hypothetical protein